MIASERHQTAHSHFSKKTLRNQIFACSTFSTRNMTKMRENWINVIYSAVVGLWAGACALMAKPLGGSARITAQEKARKFNVVLISPVQRTIANRFDHFSASSSSECFEREMGIVRRHDTTAVASGNWRQLWNFILIIGTMFWFAGRRFVFIRVRARTCHTFFDYKVKLQVINCCGGIRQQIIYGWYAVERRSHHNCKITVFNAKVAKAFIISLEVRWSGVLEHCDKIVVLY